jgi:uncharacterized protein YeaO (DUF488 family)
MAIEIKRVYETPGRDGVRVLVDRLWPRGLTKEDARLDFWLKDVAPSSELRRWFHERPLQWPAFRRKYLEELGVAPASTALEELHQLAASEKLVTLLFASKNTERNNALVLKELLDGMRKPPRSSGSARVPARVSRRARAR